MSQPQFRAVIYRGSFYAVWKADGATKRIALRTKDREAAERRLKAFAEQYEIASRPTIITVEYVWNGYRDTLKGRSSYATAGFEARALLGRFGTIEASKVSEQDCRSYCALRRGSGRKDGTIWTELGRLRSALKWAERQNLISKAPYIYRPAAASPRDLRLTREQGAMFLNSCLTPHGRLFCILALTTGARAGALLGLTWDRVNFGGRLIDLADPDRPRTNKRRAVVPINDTLMEALTKAKPGAQTPYVIEWCGRPVKSIKKGLAAAGKRCGLPWVTAHVFRHSAASWMAEAGVPMFEIAQFLGHSDSRTTEKTYARLSPAYLRGAAEALEIDAVRLEKAK